MKKLNWTKLLNISLIIFASLCATAILLLGVLKKPLPNVMADDLIDGMPFSVGVVSRTATDFEDGQFVYTSDSEFNGEVRTIEQNEYVMLNNYNVENRLANNEGLANALVVENLYISLGQKDKTDGVILTGLAITVQLNGTVIENVGELKPYTEGAELSSGCYYYAYFDAKNYGEGYYTISFRYNYMLDGERYNNRNYSYSFYLMEQTSYATYPRVENAQYGNPVNKKIQYFYNYTVANLPTYTFDAYHYNISYTRTKNNETETVSSSFALSFDGSSGTLTLVSSLKGTTTINVPKTNDEEYFVTLTFDELGTYEFVNKYQVKTSTGFNVVENILAYDVHQQNTEGTNDYEIGRLQKGYVRLHVFGIKAYFTKNGVGTEFKTETVQPDKTHLIYDNLYSGNQLDANFGFANTILNDGSISEQHKQYPTTNLAPIYFDYYGKFNFNSTTPISRYKIYSTPDFLAGVDNKNVVEYGYLTKDSNLETAGYYELIFEYTYDSYNLTNEHDVTLGGNYAHRQAFMFRIDNSTPNIKMFYGDPADNKEMPNEAFTNNYVTADWPSTTYFQADITAEIFKFNFNGEPVDIDGTVTETSEPISYTNLTPIGNVTDPNAKYILRVYFTESKDVYVEYEFTIDNTPIQNLKFQPIDAVYSQTDTTSPTGFRLVTDPNTINIEGKKLINQPFTFTYSPKESGAAITTKYYKIPFSANTNATRLINDSTSIYIANDYAIDVLNPSNAIEYNLSYASIANNVVEADNAFNEVNSYIYYFLLQDQAGNTAEKYIIYDLTKPYVIVDSSTKTSGINPIENAYNIVNEEAQVTWGDYKAVPVIIPTSETTIKPLLNNIISTETQLFRVINGTTYMCSPITRLMFENKTNGKYLVLQQPQTVPEITLYPTLPQGEVTTVQQFFSGEASYGYTVTDSSQITSLTSIANSNSITKSIWMNLDNAMGIAYGNYSTSLNDVGEPLNTKSVTNSNQLRFTYIPGEGNYAVKNVSYRYYRFNPKDYSEISDDYLSNYAESIQDGTPFSVYPYEKTPSKDFNIGTITIDPKLSITGDSQRVVSEVINPINDNNTVVTQPGMYVVKREYNATEADFAGSLDTLVRYYYYFVDRTKIISIETGSEAPADTNIYQDAEESTQNKMLYQTGSGILFNFGKAVNQQFDTYYTAKQIQQYLAFSQSNTSIFDSNKLSIYWNIPHDKYNSNLTLTRTPALASPALTNYISTITEQNNYMFNLKYVVSFNANGTGTATRVIDSTDPTNVLVNLDYLTKTTHNQYVFKNAGTYTVTIYDSSDARLNKSDYPINEQKNTSLTFSFVISHESPKGEYYSKYNDENKTPMLIQHKTELTNETIFKSINNNSLKFEFEKTSDKYRAEIDPTNIKVTKTVNNATTTIYEKVNQPIDNTILVENATGYSLTIFDEEEYLNNGNAYIGGSGQSRDYILSQSNNITYSVTLQYIGNRADYNTDSGINYFSRTFTITLDRIKPQYNYNKLIEIDNLKYGASTNVNINLEKYFFPINDSFQFTQSSEYGNELDSSEIFVRFLSGKNATNDFPVYEKTLTPDDENYYNDSLSNIRFSEANTAFRKLSYSGGVIDARDAFSGVNTAPISGYYEIVERDEAQNYKVYTVQYQENRVSPAEITYEYTPAKLGEGSNNIQGVINSQTNSAAGGIQILGKALKLINISSGAAGTNDYFYKLDISYNGIAIPSIYNNPNDRSNSTSWDDFIKLVNQKLVFDEQQNGYKVVLRFYNRFAYTYNPSDRSVTSNADYVVTYNIPGDRLTPIIVDDKNENGDDIFTITIPNDVAGTYIKGFIADRFENGAWSRLSQDSLGATIISSEDDNSSLQGLSYTFGLGEYRFQLIDNFNRGDLNYDPGSAHYKGLGVDDVKSLAFGTHQQINGVYYTAGNAVLTYQTNLYALKIETLLESGVYAEVAEEAFAANFITEQSLVNGVRTLVFENPNKNTKRNYRVYLSVEKANSQPAPYQFCIDRTLPEIELKNLSGGRITTSLNQNEPSIHTENFIVTWATNDFNPTVNLKRVYTDANGKQQTQTINNIANGYQVSEIGTYTASITNNLNYQDSSKNIYFKLISGEIVVYDVVAINSFNEKILQPSPITSTINIDGSQKILYRYYALSTYNNPQGSEKYIEVRVNKNKGLEYTLLNPDSTNYKQYRIFGTSNYGYERYIEIVYIDEFVNGLDENSNIDVSFTNLSIGTPQIVEGQETGSLVEIPIKKEITSINKSITLSWDSCYIGTADPAALAGNLIYADYSFNGVYARTISTSVNALNIFEITTAGIHKFKFYDLAGNIQKFNGADELTINLINDVLFTVNEQNPINNQIYNGEVIIEIINRHLYSADPVISATLNGVAVEVEKIGTSFYQYRFVNQGYYEITLSTKVNTTTGESNDVLTVYSFTIINSNQALPCFNVPQNANFRVVRVLKENNDITYTLTSLNELWISPATLGTGNYTVTLSKYNEETDITTEFSFNVWINNEIPYIIASIPFGTGTTNNITFTYNPKLIYDQIGESYILTTGVKILINADSPNEITTHTLTQNQAHYIQIFTNDNKLVSSYKVIKEEPLNSTSIIIIVIASVLVVALIVVFIVIRVRLRFR